MTNNKTRTNHKPKQTALQKLTSICSAIDYSLDELVGVSLTGTPREVNAQIDIHCNQMQVLIDYLRKLNDRQGAK